MSMAYLLLGMEVPQTRFMKDITAVLRTVKLVSLFIPAAIPVCAFIHSGEQDCRHPSVVRVFAAALHYLLDVSFYV